MQQYGAVELCVRGPNELFHSASVPTQRMYTVYPKDAAVGHAAL